MLAYRYLEEGTRRVAFTRDAGGARLPVQGSVWLFAGPVELDRPDPPHAPDHAGVRAVEVKTEILRKGYFLWPDDAAPLDEPRTFQG
jgi:hypothetical protein